MQNRWMQLLLVATLLAGAMLAAAPWLSRQTPAQLAEFWRRQTLAASDDEAPQLMRELTNLGAPGLRALAALIASERAAVSGEAQRLIAIEVDRCASMDAAKAAERLDPLVEALADQIDDFGPAGRQFAENLVERLLRGDSRGTHLVSDAALPACERILQAAAEDHRSSRQARREATAAEIEAVLAPYPVDIEPKKPAPSAPMVASEPEPEPDDTPQPVAEANAGQRVQVLSTAEEVDSLTPPDPLDLVPDPLGESSELSSQRPGGSRVRRAQLMQPVEANPLRPLVPEESRIIGWIRQLKNPDPRVAREAERLLAEAGFDGRQLDLARQLVSHDPAVREQLAEALPRIPGIDAKTWLLWLARDERAEVRRAAIGVMATINDPELAREIEEIARRDPDRRVQEQAERIKAMRRGAEAGMRHY